MRHDKPGAIAPAHPCAREGPRPVVRFAVNERGGSILSYSAHFNSHGKAYLTERFYERKKTSVRPRQAWRPQRCLPGAVTAQDGLRPPRHLCQQREAFPLGSTCNCSCWGPGPKPTFQTCQFHFSKRTNISRPMKFYFFFPTFLTLYQYKNRFIFLIIYFSDYMLMKKSYNIKNIKMALSIYNQSPS